ncbi:carbohydrate kinase family protein [Sulfobacillus thermosulfidooxidans]|uniref:carbohydrate kinase family protein n=1 Tax=Sulfobacillus thermosulfidooxidans TaxID=28034 RepID=UPI0006B4795E|nr:carbohydrate kinase family protein [Sulfobacillus thermosulfidooxidans]
MADIDVLVLGDTAWDTVVRTNKPLRFGHDMPAQIFAGPGGQGLNMAVSANKENAKTALITQIGCDDRSQFLRNWILQQGIALPLLTEEEPLTQVVAVVRNDGERALLTDPGKGPLAWPPSPIQPRILLISGYLLDRNDGAERVTAWMKWAREQEATILLDAAHLRLAPQLAVMLEYADWLLANEEEWKALGSPRSSAVLLKRGASGIVVMQANEKLQIPSPPGNIIDTTGAGDAVAGSFAAMLAKNRNPLEAATRAVLRGVETCGHLGAVCWENVNHPTWPEGRSL